MKGRGQVIIGVLVCVLLAFMPFLISMGGDVRKEYEERGIDVEATVTDVVRIRKNRFVTAEYVAPDGSVISASAAMNRASVRVGDVFIGKVLPEKPYEVYDMPSETLVMATNVLFYALSLIGWIGLICMCVVWKRTGKFKREGIYAQARVIDYRMEGNYYVEILAFYTKEGVYFRTESLVAEGSPQVGRTYTIQYMPDDPKQIYIVN